MKPLVVTGAAGFIGSRFVESCQRLGIPVISVDAVSHFQRPELQGIKFGEIVDREAFPAWLRENSNAVQAVMHLGARTDTSELDQGVLDRLNFQSSKEIWAVCTEKKLPLIYASSAATYGE